MSAKNSSAPVLSVENSGMLLVNSHEPNLPSQPPPKPSLGSHASSSQNTREYQAPRRASFTNKYLEEEAEQICDRLKLLAEGFTDKERDFRSAVKFCRTIKRRIVEAKRKGNNENALYFVYILICVVLKNNLNHKSIVSKDGRSKYGERTVKMHKDILKQLGVVPLLIAELKKKIKKQVRQEWENDAANPETMEFTKSSVYGDGHCFYRCIAKALNEGVVLSKEEERTEALKYRKMSVDLLQSHKDEPLEDFGITLKQRVEMDDSWDTYIRRMKKDGYAGDTEAYLLGRELGLRFCFYMPDESNPGAYKLINKSGENGKRPIHLLWQQGLNGEAGNHYSLLVPKQRVFREMGQNSTGI
eukprot:snap_masked-scaffold_35-processed-gene-0.2-mRNA-1 protein AED:1.00 eAED:1.00 QI:0/-1/0/0/-1/1/1/0/357